MSLRRSCKAKAKAKAKDRLLIAAGSEFLAELLEVEYPRAEMDVLSTTPFRDRSRGFRHELLIRVARARLGTTRFRPLCNATDDLRICVQCGKMAPKMMRCAGCRWARYCDGVCQRAHWRVYRTDCCPDHCLPSGIVRATGRTQLMPEILCHFVLATEPVSPA